VHDGTGTGYIETSPGNSNTINDLLKQVNETDIYGGALHDSLVFKTEDNGAVILKT